MSNFINVLGKQYFGLKMWSYLINMILLGFYGFWPGLLFRFYGRLSFPFSLELRQEFRSMRVIGVLRDKLPPEVTNSLPVSFSSFHLKFFGEAIHLLSFEK